MRLTCPNCNAQYEVGDTVIPPGGRDVQCSACGTTWFQYPAEVALRMRAADLDDDDDDPDDPAPAPARPAEGAAQRVDKTVLDVLRQEAQRELEARRAAAPPVETQPELGLVGRPRPRPATETAEAQPRRPAPETAEARRSRLPDIETLSPKIETASANREADARAAPPPQPEAPVAPPPSGFRRGLAYVLLALAVLVALYLLAPPLARAVPALAGPLAGYVAMVDALRLAVAGLLGG